MKDNQMVNLEAQELFAAMKRVVEHERVRVSRRVTALWAFGPERLNDVREELEIHLDVYDFDKIIGDDAPEPFGAFEVFEIFLRVEGPPNEWKDFDEIDPEKDSSLRELSAMDCYLALATNLIESAEHFLSGEACAGGWTLPDALSQGCVDLAGAERSLCKAELLALQFQERRSLTRNAAAKRHERTYLIREKAVELFNASDVWKSTLQAARAIFPEVAEFAMDQGVRMSTERGEKTVYDWLRAHIKNRRDRGNV